ncbi:MAG: D-aminoacyl-tRNA deacylase [Tenericutes bacterium]|nr:D-aminoacyl-tRNA deacylase [Mycoplasmatota bacterium]
MRVLVQRSLSSRVSVDDKVIGSIPKGFVLLVGFSKEDTISDIEYCVQKIKKLRIFNDENNQMNLSIDDIEGQILSISQFTLYGDATKGNRPSFIEAMSYEEAKKMYEIFNQKLKEKGLKVETGEFGADMKVEITNDGPVTIWIESR